VDVKLNGGTVPSTHVVLIWYKVYKHDDDFTVTGETLELWSSETEKPEEVRHILVETGTEYVAISYTKETGEKMFIQMIPYPLVERIVVDLTLEKVEEDKRKLSRRERENGR